MKDVFNPNVVQLMKLLGDRAAASLKLQRWTQDGGSHRNKSYVLLYNWLQPAPAAGCDYGILWYNTSAKITVSLEHACTAGRGPRVRVRVRTDFTCFIQVKWTREVIAGGLCTPRPNDTLCSFERLATKLKMYTAICCIHREVLLRDKNGWSWDANRPNGTFTSIKHNWTGNSRKRNSVLQKKAVVIKEHSVLFSRSILGTMEPSINI